MYNQLIRHVLCIIALLISSNIASSNSYYQDAISNFQNSNFKKTIEFLVDKNDSNLRIDIFLSKKINFLTRSNIQRLINEKNLKVNDKIELN